MTYRELLHMIQTEFTDEQLDQEMVVFEPYLSESKEFGVYLHSCEGFGPDFRFYIDM